MKENQLPGRFDYQLRQAAYSLTSVAIPQISGKVGVSEFLFKSHMTNKCCYDECSGLGRAKMLQKTLYASALCICSENPLQHFLIFGVKPEVSCWMDTPTYTQSNNVNAFPD